MSVTSPLFLTHFLNYNTIKSSHKYSKSAKKLPLKTTLFYHVRDSNDLNTGNVRYSDAVGFSKLY